MRVRNAKLRFVCREVNLRVERADTPFTRAYRKGDVIKIPVAHGEGTYGRRGNHPPAGDRGARGVPLCARRRRDRRDGRPNGAINGIAGIYSEKFNILGMMPHPENYIEPEIGPTDGRGLFESLAAALKAA